MVVHWWFVGVAAQVSHLQDPEYVFVDPHVLATPAIADIDGDGHEELVVPVRCARTTYYNHIAFVFIQLF